MYLITDTKTGKLYVGSATSQYGMLLQRWKSYIDNGTGGNKALEELKAKKGFDYIKKYYTETAFHGCRETRFELATLGNDAGIYGTAKLMLK